MNPVKELSQLFIDGQHSLSWKYLSNMIEADTTSAEVYGYLSDTMDTVGELWEMNVATMADEYVAAAVCKSMISNYYYSKVNRAHNEVDSIQYPAMKSRVLLLSMRNEKHTIGMMMTSYLFKEYGWDASCIEPNESMDHIRQYAEKWKPDVIAFSTSAIYNIPTVIGYIEELLKLNYSPTIMLGGKLTTDFDLDYYCPPNTVVIQNIDQLDTWIEKSNSRTDRHGNAITRKQI